MNHLRVIVYLRWFLVDIMNQKDDHLTNNFWAQIWELHFTEKAANDRKGTSLKTGYPRVIPILYGKRDLWHTV